MTDDRIARLRREYEARGLVETDMASDPFAEFDRWFSGAVESGIDEPNAFVLATATPEGRPSARAVLMKGFDPTGLVFYTGLESRKSRELAANPEAAATFVWTPLHRQVRFEGAVVPVDADTADDYFATRPRGSQIAAHASPQSARIESRDQLDERFRRLEEAFEGGIVPRPRGWGGWRLIPSSVEFWQGRPNRFHDRIAYSRESAGWAKNRLAP